MKNIVIFTTLMLLMVQPLFAQQSAEKTLAKAFNTENKSKLILDLPGESELVVWDKPTISVEITIQLPGKSQSMLNELANVGRYNLESVPQDDNLIIRAKNMSKQITVGGEVLIENMKFVVYIPSGLEVEIVGSNAMVHSQK